MPFQRGHAQLGGVRPGFSQVTKRKYLAKWEQVFDSTDPIKKLTELANSDYPEFLRLGLAAMPKDQTVDLTISRFSAWTPEQLRRFIVTGQYPDGEDGDVGDVGD